MQINGDFEGLTLFSYFLCMKFEVWVGNIMTPVKLQGLYHAFTTAMGSSKASWESGDGFDDSTRSRNPETPGRGGTTKTG